MSTGFWVKEQTYYEQPEVTFNGDLIVALMDDHGRSMTYATRHSINRMQTSWTGGVPTISMRHIMDERNGKLSTLRLQIELPGVEASKVRNVQVYSSFEYLLSSKL